MSELTIEQMRQIVDGAPDWAKGYNTAIQKYTRSVWFSKDILLSDLKDQIDQHYYGQSEEKELEQYAILSQEKIEGGAVLVGGSCIQKMVDYQDVIANQKAEIDQLKKQLSDSDYLKVQHRERRCELNKEVEKLKAEKEKLKAEKAGLEKRVDGALKITKKMATSINSVALWSLDLDKTLRGTND